MTENGRQKTESTLLFISLAIMAASLTLSPFMMSVSQFLLLFTWLFTGDPVKVKLKRFFHNRIALLLVSLYLLHVVGLIYTTDFQYALKDLRVKLPLLVFPVTLSTMKPLDKKHFDLLMQVYVIAVFIGTCISFSIWLSHEYIEIRSISPIISHIRFCLNIVLVVGIIGYYLFKRPTPWWEKLLQIAFIVWFLFQLFIFESLSGYLALIGMVTASLLYVCLTKMKSVLWRTVIVIVIIGLPLTAGIIGYHWASSMLNVPPVDFGRLDQKTAQGNDYTHDTIDFPLEDGQYVGLYLCREELREAWNSRSTLDYDGLTLNGESMEVTLTRYLTSKGLRKDAEGVAALDDQDIQNVEHGVANYVNWTHPGVHSRISSTLFEYSHYQRGHNPNGGSLSQRLEYTKASFYLIKKHPVFGVGTGDIPSAYAQAYDDLQSPLEQQFRHKAHNQYLSITVGFGVVGLVLFLIVLLYPYLSSKRYRNYLYTIFMVILLISMLPEDTIETQAGVSWFAFFNSLLIFAL